MKRICQRLILLFAFLSSLGFSQSIHDSLKCDSLIQEAAAIFRTKPDSANLLLLQTEKIIQSHLQNKAEDQKNKIVFRGRLCDLYRTSGFIERNKGNFERAIAFYKKSMEVASDNKFNSKLATALNNLAFAYNKIGKIDFALDLDRKSVV